MRLVSEVSVTDPRAAGNTPDHDSRVQMDINDCDALPPASEEDGIRPGDSRTFRLVDAEDEHRRWPVQSRCTPASVMEGHPVLISHLQRAASHVSSIGRLDGDGRRREIAAWYIAHGREPDGGGNWPWRGRSSLVVTIQREGMDHASYGFSADSGSRTLRWPDGHTMAGTVLSISSTGDTVARRRYAARTVASGSPFEIS